MPSREEISRDMGPSGTPYCSLCGLLWLEHEKDEQIGPMGLKTWVCRLTEKEYNVLLEWLEDESNW